MNLELQILKVIWKDAEFQQGWLHADEFNSWAETGMSEIESVGYLTYDGPDYIILTQNAGPELLGESIKIIKSNILDRIELCS